MLVQVLIRKHLRPAFEGDESLTLTHDYRVDAEYLPGYAGDREAPPEDEGFAINAIYHSDGKTPVLLTESQLREIEEIMLDNVHDTLDDDRVWRERNRYTD